MSSRNEKKKKHQVPITSLSLHWAIYLPKPVYIVAWPGNSSSEKEKCIVIIYYKKNVASLCHILYFDVAKLSIKQFLLVYFSISIVRKRNEYEIVTETWTNKTT